MAETNQNIQPGAVIGPEGAQPVVFAEAQAVPQQPLQPMPAAIAPIPDQTAQQPALPTPPPSTAVDQPPQPPAEPLAALNESYSWTAAEFIAHHKTPQWFVAFGAVCIVIIAAVFLITKDKTAVLALAVGAVAVGIYAGRAPRAQHFLIDSQGFTIGQRRFSFEQFKSFSIIHEDNLSSVQFMPLKRFAPYTTIYYGSEDEDQVLDIVEQVLPYVEHAGDPIDRLLRRVRF